MGYYHTLVMLMRKIENILFTGVWSPGKGGEKIPVIAQTPPQKRPSPPKDLKCNESAPVVWTPRSAGSSPTADRKEFRPVTFESPVLSRKNQTSKVCIFILYFVV